MTEPEAEEPARDDAARHWPPAFDCDGCGRPMTKRRYYEVPFCDECLAAAWEQQRDKVARDAAPDDE
jgi:hypothetical protein